MISNGWTSKAVTLLYYSAGCLWMPAAASQQGRRWLLFYVYLTASLRYKTNLWWNERKLRRKVEIASVFYRGRFSTVKQKQTGFWKRTSASLGYKTGLRKAYNSLSSRLARGKQKSLRTCTHIILPERALLRASNITFSLLHRWRWGQHPRSLGMCSDSLPANPLWSWNGIFICGHDFFFFFCMPSGSSEIQNQSSSCYKFIDVTGHSTIAH